MFNVSVCKVHIKMPEYKRIIFVAALPSCSLLCLVQNVVEIHTEQTESVMFIGNVNRKAHQTYYVKH